MTSIPVAQDFTLAGFRLEPVKLKAYAVRPVQRVSVRVPHRRLTIQVAEVCDNFGLLHSCYAGMYTERGSPSGTTDDGFMALFVRLAHQEIEIASFISLKDVIKKHGVVATAVLLVGRAPCFQPAAQFRI